MLIQNNVEMQQIDKEYVIIENSKSCQTEIPVPPVQSISLKKMKVTIQLLKKMKTTLHLSVQSN